jgi:hypothetical protein
LEPGPATRSESASSAATPGLHPGLAVDFFISLLNTVDGWAGRTLAEIEGWEDLTPDGKNDRGLEIFAQLPAPTPREPTDRTPVPPRTQRRRRSSGSGSTP